MPSEDAIIKKAIVVGLDGFEPRIVDALMERGALPNLERLARQGHYSRVRSTNPALTPAAWSTFATGVNPGGHGIFDFVHRDPKTYLPILSLNRYEQKNAFVPPRATNMRRGTPIWELLTEAGVPSTVVRCPCTFPPDPIYGRMLAGVGVPDLRGGLGTTTFYTSLDGVEAGESETVVQVHAESRGAERTIKTHLVGPRNPKARDDFKHEVTLRLFPEAGKIAIETDGQPRSLEVREGQWSDWLHVRFKTGLFQSVPGMVRFYPVRIAPELELYASPINFEPGAPLFPVSSPPEYAAELAAKLGTFYTTGMVEDHTGLNNNRFDEGAYVDQCQGVMRERLAMMTYELDRFDQGFFYCLFDTPDRMAHMFWRCREDEHPANRDGLAIPESLRSAIEDQYRECDSAVGCAMEHADDETLLVVLSDHGMSSFQRGFNVNAWLREQGLLALKPGLEPGASAGDFLRGVDWSQTRAYAVGLNGLYLNIAGREGEGIVPADEADGLRRAIATSLTGIADPERGQLAIRSARTVDEVYSGPYVQEAPDVVINFAAGYRASWATPLGGVPAALFEDNPKKWSGDHAVDPALVPGVLFMNRSFRPEGACLEDLAPTILKALGVQRGPAMEGEDLLA